MAVIKGDEFRIPIGAEDKTSPAFSKINAAAAKMMKVFDQVGVAGVKLNQTLELLGRVQAKVQKAFDVTIGSAIRLEKNVAEITTLLSDATGAQAYFTNEILKMQAQFGGTQDDIARAYYEALSSGAVDAANATNLLSVANKLAIGGVTDLTTATDGLTNIMNAYGLSAEDAASISDALFVGMKVGKTTIGELSRDLGKAASLASNMGVGFDELIAAVSAITTGGVKTSEAVTQVRGALVALSRQTEPMQEAMKKLGINSIQAAIGQRGLVGVIKDLAGATDGSAESLQRMFSDVEAVNAATSLTSKTIGGKFNVILDEMSAAAQKAGEVTQDAFKKIADTADFRLRILEGKAQARLTKIGNAFLVVLVPVLETMDKLFMSMEKAIDDISMAFDRLADAVRGVDFAALSRDIKLFATILGTIALILGQQLIIKGILAVTAVISTQLIPTLAVLGIWVKTVLIPAAIPLAVVAAKFLLISASVIGIAAAIELLIRNWNKLPQLGELFALVFVKATVEVTSAFAQMFMFINSNLISMLSTVGTVFNVASSQILSVQRGALKLSEQLADGIISLNDQGEKLNESIGKAAAGIDFGFTGTVITEAKKMWESFNAEVAKTGDEAEKAQKKLEQIAPEIKRDITVELPKLFDDKQIELIQAAFGGGAAGIAKAANAMLMVPLAMAAAADIIMDAVKKLIDLIPGLLNKLADILNSLAELPFKIMEGFQNVLNGAINLIANILPNLVMAIEGIVVAAVDFLARDLPKAVVSIAERVPELLARFVERLPELARDFALGLVRSGATMAVKFVAALIKSVPRLITAIVRETPRIAQELANGLILGVKELINEIANLFGMADIFNIGDLDKQISNMGDSIARAASNLFQVIDLEATARGLDVADRIRAAIGSSLIRLADLWRMLIDALRRVWEWIRDTILMPLWNALVKAWEWIKDNVVMPLINGIMTAFQWVVDHILMPLASIIQQAFAWVITNVIDPLINGIKAAWEAVKKGVIDPLITGLQAVFEFLKKTVVDLWIKPLEKLLNFMKDSVLDPFMKGLNKLFDPKSFTDLGTKIWDGLKAGLQTAGDVLTNALNAINPGNLFTKMFQMDYQGQGLVERTLGIDIPFANFAQGGMVPGQALVPGDSLMNDRILALLSPGEAVIPRSKMDDPATRMLIDAVLNGDMVPSRFARGGVIGEVLSKGGGLLAGLSGAVSGALGAAAGPIMQTLSGEAFGRLAAAIEGGLDPRKASVGQLATIIGTFGDAQKVMDKLDMTISGVSKKSLDAISVTIDEIKRGAGSAKEALAMIGSFIDPSQLWAIAKEELFKAMIRMFEANKFHSGGLVPAFAGGGEVPAMLQPGEFVLRRQAVSGNLSALETFNRTGDINNMSAGPTTINVTINTKTDLSPEQIRREVVPAVKDQLRRASLDGAFVIDKKGIR